MTPARAKRPGVAKIMTSNHLKGLCALICLQVCFSHAQDAEVPTRAQRDAGNPLRMIIEASKLKPRQKAIEAEPAARAAPEKVAARQPVGKPAAAIAAPQPEQAAAPVRAPSTTLDAGAEAATPVAAVPYEPLPTEPPTPVPTRPVALTAPPLPVPAARSAPEPERQLALTAPAPLTPSAPPAVARAAALQLADYVEPDLPDRLRRRLQADANVVLDFTVNPDGSLADVAVRASSDRALDAIAVDAVRQWRYRPIATAQAHAVQLVFRRRD